MADHLKPWPLIANELELNLSNQWQQQSHQQDYPADPEPLDEGNLHEPRLNKAQLALHRHRLNRDSLDPYRRSITQVSREPNSRRSPRT